MTNDRDPELAELLGADPTPEHGPDFWDDLDAALAAEPAPVDEPTTAPTDGTAAPVEFELDDEASAEVVSIESHPRFRRWGVAVIGIAAVAIAAVIGINLTQDDDAGPPPVVTDPTTPTAPATPDTTPVDSTTPTAPSPNAPTPIGLIDGTFAGLLDDDTALVLRDELEAVDPACGAGTGRGLWLVPLEGSEPAQIGSGLGAPAAFTAGPDLRLAGLAGCGSLTTLFVEDWGDDNNEIFGASIGEFPVDGGEATALTEVVWADADTLVAVGETTIGGRAWSIDLTSDASPVEQPFVDVVDVTIGFERELLVLGADYVASGADPTPLDGDAVPGLTTRGPVAYNRAGQLWFLGDDDPQADFEAERIFPAPVGGPVLAAADDGLWTIAGEASLLDADGTDGSWTTDSTRFVYTAEVGGGRTEVRMLDFDTSDPPPPPTSADTPTETTTATTCTPQPAPDFGSDDDAIPPAVFETRQAIAVAAANCDYEALSLLAAPGFFLGFNVADGTDPLEYWLEGEQAGSSAAEAYVGVLTDQGAVNSSGVWIWPAVSTYTAIDDIPADVLDAHLAHTGVSIEEFTQDWELLGQYVGLTLSISADGSWTGAAPPE